MYLIAATVQRHLLILVGVKNLAALFALDVLHVVFARYHAHLGMLADWLHDQFGGLDGLPARTAPAKLGRYAGDCTHVSIRVNAKSQCGFD
jgi:hypothetical protein